MKFVKKKNDIGKAYTYLDTEDLDLSSIPYNTEELRKFHIETYAVLKANATDFAWNVVFGSVHEFIREMPEEEKIDFVSMIVAMHYHIVNDLNSSVEQLQGNEVIALETKLSQILAAYDQKYNLVNRLIDFANRKVPIHSFAGVGERDQDSADMTFYRDDVVRLTAAALLCKMLTTIFGTFIEACKKRSDNSYKEIHAFAILKDIMANRLQALMDKVDHFVAKIIKPILNKVNLTHLYNGYTFNVIKEQIKAYMFVRRFIAVDLFKENGNLMTYVTACARAAAQTQFDSTNLKIAVSEIITPRDSSTDDDGNVSTLEAESRSSSRTSDYTLIIEMSVAKLAERIPVEYNLDNERIQAAKAYYDLNHVEQTDINRFILGTVFGPELGGAKSIESLNGDDMNLLIAILQEYLLNQGYTDILQAVSLTPTGTMKSFMTGSDTQLRATWNTSFEYRNCDNALPFSCNDLRWDSGLKATVDNVTTEELLCNTAPIFLEAMGVESQNGQVYNVPDTLAKSICSLISQQLAVHS